MKTQKLIEQLYSNEGLSGILPPATPSNFRMAGRVCKDYPDTVIENCIDLVGKARRYLLDVKEEDRVRAVLCILINKCQWYIVDKNLTTDKGTNIVSDIL